jgi:branched-chain amino acid transport system substrate-binding protein
MTHPQCAKGLFWRLGIVLPLLAVALSGCKQPSGTTSGTAGGTAQTDAGGQAADVGKAAPYVGEEIVLGEYGSLTGTAAAFGTSTRDGVKMAVDEANAAGGVLGKKIRIQLEDDAGQPQQATTVVKKLINQNNVLAVLGEVASTRSIAGGKVCQAAGVPMISPTSTNPKVTQIGDYVFRTCFIDPFQGTIAARFASRNLKAKTAAILTDVKNDYSVGLTKFFIDEFTKLGGRVVGQESFKEGDTEFRSQLSNIKSTNPDVIFIPGYYTEAGTIAKQARDLGISQPMLGGDGWDAPELVTIGGDAVQGSYFSTHASPESKDPRTVKFVADFKRQFGNMPNALSAVAYDAARIMIDSIKRAGSTDRAKIRDAIAATKNFPGVTGNITIDKDRNAIKPLVIVQVKGDQFKYVTTINP